MRYINYGNYGFTTRNGGVSIGSYATNNLGLHTKDKKENVIKNRELLAKDLNIPLDNFVFGQQEHTNNYYKVTKEDCGKGVYTTDDAIKSTDALYTFENNIVLATFHADCTPVFFHSKKHNVIGVIHAGWLGTAREITYKTLKHIIDEYKINPSDISVHVGPSISAEVYEVKQDLVDHFDERYKDTFTYKNNKIYFDTAKANLIQIQSLNITNVKHDNRCTFKNEDLFFSHRREANAGRMLAFIYQ